jgi:hypothetical protein
MADRADLIQEVAEAVSWCGQDQSRPERVVLLDRKAEVVGSGVADVGDGADGGRMEWRIEAVGRSVTVQRGKSERSAADATGEDSVRRNGAERRRGWDRWRAAGKVPKRQSREIQAVVAEDCMAAIEEERSVADWLVWCVVWQKETGRERRETGAGGVAMAATAGEAEAAGLAEAVETVVGHFVVNRGKRVGSKAAGLAAKAVVREVARNVS